MAKESDSAAGEVKELTKSTSNLNDVLYGGRPKNEEPHVKRTTKKKSEKIDYIVRVDLEELKINDDEFEDLQSLFILFDLDKDGILNAKEFEKILRCLGYRLQADQAWALAKTVSVDKTNCSVSFNEFLTLMSVQQEVEPDHETLVDVFASFDREALGKISETQFVELLKAKDDIEDEDIQEMLDEYYRLAKLKGITTEKPDPPSDSEDEDGNETKKPRPPPPPPQKIVKSPPSTKRNSKIPSIKSPTETVKEPEKWIDYREFALMLQQ